MASLKFYDGAKPGKNRKLLLNERFEKKKEYETLRQERFSEKWQRNRKWLVFDKEKQVMTCIDCVTF